MNEIAQRGTMVLLLAMLSLAVSLGSSQSDLKELLKQKISPIEISRSNSYEILGDLASKYRLPVGVEVAPDKIEKKSDSTKISLSSGSVKDVLDAFTSVNPGYRWEERDGVVNVFPEKGGEPLLNIKVSRLSVQSESAEEVCSSLTELPEMKAALKELGLKRDYTTPMPLILHHKRPRLSFELENVTVREILNFLLRRAGKRYWVVYRPGDENQFVAIRLW